MNKRSFRTAILFSLVLFAIITITSFLTMTLTMLMYRFELLNTHRNPVVILVPVAISVLVSTIMSRRIGKRPIHAIEEISQATKDVANGNFSVQLKQSIPIEEFQEMVTNFNIMTKQLASTEMLRNDFIANVSHEFKTPLAAIEGYSTLLQKKGLSEEKRMEYTARILYNTKRLTTLTGNILLLSKLENQEIGISKEKFCLDEQLREIILLFEDQWSEKNLELDIDLDNVDYIGSKELLAQVWQNILENAIKFTPQDGKIQVLLRAEADNIKIIIADNGVGMDEETRKRVFEKFYQGDSSRTSTGNGLGLALAKRIVDLHNGDISISSKENRGTTFTVVLPK